MVYQNQFETITNQETAYWLGFLAAGGLPLLERKRITAIELLQRLHEIKRQQQSRIRTPLAIICPICQKEFLTSKLDAKYCSQKCAHQAQQKVSRPSKETLYQLLINMRGNFSQIGKHFHVSDNAVRKWCKSYNLPSHSVDYKTYGAQSSNL